jgi:membrane protein implicated in regulation of membrane protease activity
MQSPSVFDAPIYALTVAVGVGLVVLARWAARRKGTRWESLVALRIGDVLFTEILGMFLIGFGIGALVVPQLDRGGVPGGPGGGPPPGGVVVGRGGRFLSAVSDSRLPLMLGLVLAAIAAVVRIDWTDHLLRGPNRSNTLSTYIGWDARVVAPITAGGFGEIALPDGSGNVMAVVATADTDIALGTQVRVTGTKDLNLVVKPIAAR